MQLKTLIKFTNYKLQIKRLVKARLFLIEAAKQAWETKMYPDFVKSLSL